METTGAVNSFADNMCSHGWYTKPVKEKLKQIQPPFPYEYTHKGPIMNINPVIFGQLTI